MEKDMELANQFLKQYELNIQKLELLRHNENMTYKVVTAEGQYVLRIHKSIDAMNLSLLQGKWKAAELIGGEMKLMACLEESPLRTQKPIKNVAGSYVTAVGEYVATLLSWIPGECLQKPKVDSSVAERLGEMLAHLHNWLGNYGKEFCRYSYGTELVDSMKNICMNTGKESYSVNVTHLELMSQVLDTIRKMLEDGHGDMVLIHNDLGESNLLLSDNCISPIDFSLSGYCIREMDLASLYIHFENRELREAILAGYRKEITCNICEKKIDICIAYQLLIFIFCQLEMIQGQGWFAQALEYWCEEIFRKVIQGEPITGEIGLYV